MLDGYSSILLNARSFGKTYRERDDVPIERAHLSKMIGNQRRNGALKPGQKDRFSRDSLYLLFTQLADKMANCHGVKILRPM